MENQLRAVSTYHLIFELLHDGKGNLYSDIEPINPKSILDELRDRLGQDLGSKVEPWVEWFLASTEAGNPDELGTIATVLRIRKIENESLRRIESEDGT